jgi:hypothetical protein
MFSTFSPTTLQHVFHFFPDTQRLLTVCLGFPIKMKYMENNYISHILEAAAGARYVRNVPFFMLFSFLFLATTSWNDLKSASMIKGFLRQIQCRTGEECSLSGGSWAWRDLA